MRKQIGSALSISKSEVLVLMSLAEMVQELDAYNPDVGIWFSGPEIQEYIQSKYDLSVGHINRSLKSWNQKGLLENRSGPGTLSAKGMRCTFYRVSLPVHRAIDALDLLGGLDNYEAIKKEASYADE